MTRDDSMIEELINDQSCRNNATIMAFLTHYQAYGGSLLPITVGMVKALAQQVEVYKEQCYQLSLMQPRPIYIERPKWDTIEPEIIVSAVSDATKVTPKE